MSEPSIEPPNVFYAALAGTAIFGGAGFFCAGTVAVFRGYSHGFRYSILTALNTGVFGGIWFGSVNLAFGADGRDTSWLALLTGLCPW
jgi:hypothetical protein